MFEKIIIPILWISGACAIAYGITKDNNPVFIAGIISVIIGYIMIRKHLKRAGSESTEDKFDIPSPPDEK